MWLFLPLLMFEYILCCRACHCRRKELLILLCLGHLLLQWLQMLYKRILKRLLSAVLRSITFLLTLVLCILTFLLTLQLAKYSRLKFLLSLILCLL